MATREDRVLEIARGVGFDLAGIAPLRPPRDAGRFSSWLDAGYHAGLDYLARNRERIADPRRLAPTGRSIVVVGLAHSRAEVELAGGGRVARYAAGRDYHNVVQRLLKRMRARLVAEGLISPADRARCVADAGPLLERSHAAEAGLGFLSKAANLLHPRFGPWFFLAEILVEAELAPTSDVPAGSCGTCTACIDACPTAAILEPGLVDAERCLSYQTIENRGPIPRELRAPLGSWAFGCDVCSEVCPWGHRAPDLAARFGTHAAVASESALVSWIDLRDDAARAERLRGSALQRPGRAGLARNAAIVLGNVPSDAGRAALLRAISVDPSAVVREASAWSLARAHGADAGVRAALDAARAREPDLAARAGIARSLDSAP
jgi:epoxyqueuosine reductase